MTFPMKLSQGINLFEKGKRDMDNVTVDWLVAQAHRELILEGDPAHIKTRPEPGESSAMQGP